MLFEGATSQRAVPSDDTAIDDPLPGASSQPPVSVDRKSCVPAGCDAVEAAVNVAPQPTAQSSSHGLAPDPRRFVTSSAVTQLPAPPIPVVFVHTEKPEEGSRRVIVPVAFTV